MTAIEDAVDLTAAKHDDAVAQLQQNIQILADINDCYTALFLLIQQVVDRVGGVDVQPAHGVGGHQHNGVRGDFSPDKHLLHIAARQTGDRRVQVGRNDAQLPLDRLGQCKGGLAVHDGRMALAVAFQHHVVGHAH